LKEATQTYRLAKDGYYYRSPAAGVLCVVNTHRINPAYTKINLQAVEMLEALIAGQTVREIAEQVCQRYDVAFAVAEADVWKWLESLLRDDFIEPAD